MTGDVIHSTQYYYLGQFAVQTIATWQANSSMENTPMAIKHFFPSQLTLFQSPPTWFQYVSVFSSKNVEQGHKLKLTYLYACWIMYIVHEAPFTENGMPKVARNAFNIEEVWNPECCHGNKTVKLKLQNTSRRILLQRIKHIWYKLIISHHIWSVWLSVWSHHLANLHILKNLNISGTKRDTCIWN